MTIEVIAVIKVRDGCCPHQSWLISRQKISNTLAHHVRGLEILFYRLCPKTDRVPEQLNVSFHWHILATESKRWPRHAVQVEGKRWTISHGFAVTIKTAMTMANAGLTT